MSYPIDTDSLSAERVNAHLSTKYIGRSVIVKDTVNSTNTLGFEAAEAGLPHGTVIVAERQTAGKGRLGRTWHSPSGKNLYFSIVLTQAIPMRHVSWLPLLAGLAVAESLELVSELKVSLKWPNDILFQDKKMAGVLCESRTKNKNNATCIVGIGLNVNSQRADFPPELQTSSTSLAIECQRPFDRHIVLSTCLVNFEYHIERLLSAGSHDLRIRYGPRCQTLQRSIQVNLSNGSIVTGLATDIGQDGELRVLPSGDQVNQRTIGIRSGDVFHVR